MFTRHRILEGSLFLTVAAVLVFASFGATPPAGAEPAKKEDPNVLADAKYGVTWVKPKDLEWVFVDSKAGETIFADPKPKNFIGGLYKFEFPGGEPNRTPHIIRIWLNAYSTEGGKFTFGGKDVATDDAKGVSAGMLEQEKEKYKDIKDEKKPFPKAYAFEKKVIVCSFLGAHKESGNLEWNESMYFRANSKWMINIDINCPNKSEREVRQEIDRVLNQLKIGKPAK